MTLATVTNIVEIVGVIAIIVGIGFGLIQLRLLRKQNRDIAILEFTSSFESSEFTEAYRLIGNLPENRSIADIDALDEKYPKAIYRVAMKFETVGLLIYKGVVPIDAMEDLVGGAALMLWRVLGTWVKEKRNTGVHDSFLEWFQWLVERLQERGEAERTPAYIEFANWSAGK